MAEHALYRFFDAKDRLLYVGITNNPESRFSGHRGDKPWWRDVTTIRIERGFPDRRALAHAEVRAIEAERPKYNKAHAAGLLQTTKTPSRTVVSPGSQANTFGTVQREGPPALDPDEVRISLSHACPTCGWPAVKFRGRAECSSRDGCEWNMSLEEFERLNEPWWP